MLYVEDNAHLALVYTITSLVRQEVKKKGSKSNVVKFLQKEANALGLIDEDTNLEPQKHEPRFLREMEIISTKHDVVLRKAANGSFAIALIPRIEGWVKTYADKYKIDIKKFGLPIKEKDLHNIVNDRIQNFRKLIDELKDKDELLYLKEMILKYNK